MNQENSVEIFEEGYRNFDLKPLTEEEVAYFMDFAREQYLVRQDEALEIAQRQKEL